nr:MAG TPA: cell cycle control protein [Caudoviricetes sp.]
MKDQCKSCAKWRRCKDRSRGVACAEYKKAPAELAFQQGAQGKLSLT